MPACDERHVRPWQRPSTGVVNFTHSTVLTPWGPSALRVTHHSAKEASQRLHTVVTIPPSKWTRYCGQTPWKDVNVVTRLTGPHWVLHLDDCLSQFHYPGWKQQLARPILSFRSIVRISRKSVPLTVSITASMNSWIHQRVTIRCRPHFF